MRHTLFTLMTILLLLFATGCNRSKDEKQLKISTSRWIGYSPLFLADALGELKALNLELIQSVSLTEAMGIFSVGHADFVTTTQHEYLALKHNNHIKPIALLDRSNGGDVILANFPLKNLNNYSHIDVYLEIDSINRELFEDFASYHHLPLSRCTFHNQDQQQIQSLKNRTEHPTIVVTYSPYDITLQKRGFHTIASTKSLQDIAVIDALCTQDKTVQAYPARVKKLKKVIDRKIEQIRYHPQKSYHLLRHYLGDISFSEFQDALTRIEWINHPTPQILEITKRVGYDTTQVLP